jgi:hypothetical protein
MMIAVSLTLAVSASPPPCPDLEAGLAQVARAPTHRRVDPALKVLAGCRLGPLAGAAARAHKEGWPRRSHTLGAAALAILGPRCEVPQLEGAASALPASCPIDPAIEASASARRDLDAGTYLFAAAVLAKTDPAAKEGTARLLLDLLLAAALEGERRRGGAAR